MYKHSAINLLCRWTLAASVLLLGAQQEAFAKAFYVSPSGDGSTGQNWKKAWKDPSQIDWNQVNAGDQIVLDGGASGITYQSSMTIPKSGAAGAPITIRQSPAAGHNGNILLVGGADQPPNGYVTGLANGIVVNGSYINIAGARRGGLKIKGYRDACINIGSVAGTTTDNIGIHNVEIENRVSLPPYGSIVCVGIKFTGFNNHIVNCDFRNCNTGAKEIAAAGANNQTVFNNCTFGSTQHYLNFTRGCGTAILGAKATTGDYNSKLFVHRTIFGPYVTAGIYFYKGAANITDCLFLCPSQYAIAHQPDAGVDAKMHVRQCTFVIPSQPMTPPYGMIGSPLQSNGNGLLKVKDSVVYGGWIMTATGQSINAGGNVQYRVAGNTSALAPTLVDPQFQDEAAVAAMPSNYNPYIFSTLNYTMNPSGPAAGKGSRLVTVSELCTPYGPNGPIPPLGGP